MLPSIIYIVLTIEPRGDKSCKYRKKALYGLNRIWLHVNHRRDRTIENKVDRGHLR
jgi:hypothetical protein